MSTDELIEKLKEDIIHVVETEGVYYDKIDEIVNKCKEAIKETK